MTKRQQSSQSFTSPSPGEILKRRAMRDNLEPRTERNGPANGSVNLNYDPFKPSPFVKALRERGVMLAPLLVQWNYKVAVALPFTKWLKTKEVLLSDARLMINDNTYGAHYFGTYILQDELSGEGPGTPDAASGDARSTFAPVSCQTLWGYSSEAAMVHMFDLCRGRIDRASIVQNDLKDFVIGLKGHIAQVGTAHFSQSVLVAPAAI